MTWEIVAGMVTLLGFVISVVKTVIPLTNAITLLTEKTAELSSKMEDMDEKKTKAHTELWAHNKEQDKRLEEHAQRLHDLDGK